MSDKVIRNNNGTCYTERRATIVSFSREKDEISIQDENEDSDDFQISLAPYIQTYLSHGGEKFGCCGICFPVPFERASKRSWWDPKFDSEILEGQYRKSSFSQIRLRFRYSLIYMLILSLIWCFYLITFGIYDKSQKDAFPLGVIFFLFSIFCTIILVFTRSPLYRKYTLPVSILISLSMCLLSLASVSKSPVLSPASDFAICIEILMLIYTVIPLPLYLCVIMGSLYSIFFEILGTGFALPVRIFSHVCVHLIALHILIMTNVRMRGTFMKVGQSLLVRRQMEMEKQLKEKMIHSVMPPKVADWLMEEANIEGHHSGSDINSLFRPFNMNCMKDVSILFADIVGFTRMSSKKSASELVTVLNELFERFDDLCTHNGCEKISTLGDCYYCVSGCPTPRQDHAQCCVEMGLGMIKAIAEFDREKSEDVNMRVGVHTGTVLCGIVGRRRFKFDVWSNDVTLANKMESSGKPGRVHISQTTAKFLNELYLLEPGELYHGMETYFIVGRKDCISSTSGGSTQATVTSPGVTVNSDLSYETALASHSESLTTAPSRSTKSASCVHCTVSPFETVSSFGTPTDSRVSPPPATKSPGIATRLLCERLADAGTKATSLPNVFAREMQAATRSRASLLGSGQLLVRKPLPNFKYSRLRLNKSDMENGKIHNTYNSPSSVGSDSSPVDKSLTMQLEVPKDDLSFCQSVNSRKDSGIRSNSRRSSIQQQICLINGIVPGELLNHRVSGYYTSSQSSLSDSEKGLSKGRKLPGPLGDSLGACFQKIRKQSDLQLIRCVQDNNKSERNYLITPPLKRWSLLFKQADLEKEYRERAHRTSPSEPNKSRTLATARFNTYFDITVSLFVFTSISLSCFLIFPFFLPWTIIFILLLFIQLIIIFLCVHSIVKPVLIRRLESFLKWYPWHVIGGALVSLPAVVVLVNFHQSVTSADSLYGYACLLFVSVVHYCNFTQLNCWMKSTLATLCAIIYLVLVTVSVISNPYLITDNNSISSVSVEASTVTTSTSYPIPTTSPIPILVPDFLTNSRIKRQQKVSSFIDTSDLIDVNCENCNQQPTTTMYPTMMINSAENTTVYERNNLPRSDSFLIEIYIDLFLLVFLVWFLNREFEISYRLSFHGNAVAARDKAKVEAMKDQADWLLNNIIPKHVAEHLKCTARYSEDVKNAGIIFASIVNFGDMYDESYLEGRECLRVLNELVSDFDELLSQPRFSLVEKIKTIGSTFMAASGLNPSQRKENSNEHLYQLMEFAFALQAAIDNFNAHLLEFNLILRVGYNFGDVMAGVIGTTKLFYDIWGDAVNIASRMDTTGVAGRIQVSVSCLEVLSQRYILEHRGTVFVKGKDDMDVYLINGRKDDASSLQ
ncbi:adenylyl cyclase 13E isoform X2 [Rhodnius prolixus]|uniref:adenylyl cyclase 13E isoform X2 n=1 Tax=Rhodnius prolixus TaxID=13249 RepID=UPI003D18A60D